MDGFMPRYRLRALRPCLYLVPCPVSNQQFQYPRYEVPRVPKYQVPKYKEAPYVHGLG